MLYVYQKALVVGFGGRCRCYRVQIFIAPDYGARIDIHSQQAFEIEEKDKCLWSRNRLRWGACRLIPKRLFTDCLVALDPLCKPLPLFWLAHMCALAQLLMASRRKGCIELTFAPFEGVLRNPFCCTSKTSKKSNRLWGGSGEALSFPTSDMNKLDHGRGQSIVFERCRSPNLPTCQSRIENEILRNSTSQMNKTNQKAFVWGSWWLFQNVSNRTSSFIPAKISPIPPQSAKNHLQSEVSLMTHQTKRFPPQSPSLHIALQLIVQNSSSCAPQPFSFAS